MITPVLKVSSLGLLNRTRSVVFLAVAEIARLSGSIVSLFLPGSWAYNAEWM